MLLHFLTYNCRCTISCDDKLYRIVGNIRSTQPPYVLSAPCEVT